MEVTRHLDGDEMVWTYPGFIAKLSRIEGAE
jgi:hypothetical protein